MLKTEQINCISFPYESNEEFEISYGYADTKFGEVLIGLLEPNKICFLHFIQNKAAGLNNLKQCWPKAVYTEDSVLATKTVNAIFGKDDGGTMTLCLTGSEFQQSVYKALLKIPFGEQFTYSDVAELLGKPSAVRPVANAVGKNDIAVVIPCHRVISKSGSKFKYRFGSQIKQKLLEYESANDTF
ncbi:bifunctional transcriptional activator/DNA repair enzyme Ada-like [Teleopsis dalmanni]|uniref:bifunctional transcriptional activator/DNA repair enzyme Ada-like n=1 Tax=Teleopsis dalmanni TaxID=139649 RepID=UPI0018CDD4B0|nr:bifunctional transcriptional activator/DNA repair enzyme Ada-like [Teleopsis dalmanni]